MKLGAGERWSRETGPDEVALVPLGGRCTVVADGQTWTIGERANPFAGQPWAVYLPRDSAFEVTAETPLELAVCAARAERTSGAEADYSAGRQGGDPRRRQRRAPDQPHHRAVIRGRPPAGGRGLHAERKLVLLSAPQARRARHAAGGRSGRDLLLPDRSTGRIRVAAALHRRRADRRRLRHPRWRSLAGPGGVSRLRRGPGLHRVLPERPRRRRAGADHATERRPRLRLGARDLERRSQCRAHAPGAISPSGSTVRQGGCRASLGRV